MGICESTEAKKNENMMPYSDIHRNNISILQLLSSLCKIQTNRTMASGFLIKLFKGQEDFFCLMTNEHVITKDMVANHEKFLFYFDNEKKTREIPLDEKERYIKNFRDINIDATVIEILPKDNISPDFFLLPSIDYIFNQSQLINKEIAVLQYPSGESGYSFGKLKSINDNFEFAHSASTLPGSSGSPIILKQTSKVIGIHKMGGTSQNYGDFIRPIFNYFRNYSKNNERHENLLDNIIIKDNNKYKNMIQGILDITPNDINKNIKLFYTDMNNNIDVYINNEKINVIKDNKDWKYNFKKEGKYTFKIIFNDIITNIGGFFEYCSNITSLDFSYFNTSNITDMSFMFNKCHK